MSILERLKAKNRTVLEMQLGILGIGILFQLGSLPWPGDRLARAVSLFLGCSLAFAAVRHMFVTLDRALDLDEKSAQKAIYQGYLFRYLTAILILILAALTKWLDPLLVFLGYMSLKATAYLQPLTHRICNAIFHETDPEPEPLPPEPSQAENSEELTESV